MKTKCIAAVLLMCALGAGAIVSRVSATTLCESTGAICPFGERYAVPQKLKAALVPKTAFKITMGGVTAECDESKIVGETVKNDGLGLILHAGVGTWSLSHKGGQCVTNGGGKCTTMEWELPIGVYLISLGGNGRFVVAEGEKLSATCGGLACFYVSPPAGSSAEMEFAGGGPGEASWNAKAMALAKGAGSNPACAATATVNAEYAISEPANALWIAEGP